MYNHQLDTFLQVADAGSFSKAAEALYISSTAVMKQINLLEEGLDVQLFVRSPRGLTLTDAGKSYYQDAKYMIQYAKDAQARARNAGENFMLIKRGWNKYLDALRDDLWRDHPQINIIDFDQFTLEAFNRCENGNNVIMTIDAWDNVHPMLKTLPVEWDYTIPYGLLHSPTPSATVGSFLDAVAKLYQKT